MCSVYCWFLSFPPYHLSLVPGSTLLHHSQEIQGKLAGFSFQVDPWWTMANPVKRHESQSQPMRLGRNHWRTCGKQTLWIKRHVWGRRGFLMLFWMFPKSTAAALPPWQTLALGWHAAGRKDGSGVFQDSLRCTRNQPSSSQLVPVCMCRLKRIKINKI